MISGRAQAAMVIISGERDLIRDDAPAKNGGLWVAMGSMPHRFHHAKPSLSLPSEA
jgi:hypothetical protein